MTTSRPQGSQRQAHSLDGRNSVRSEAVLVSLNVVRMPLGQNSVRGEKGGEVRGKDLNRRGPKTKPCGRPWGAGSRGPRRSMHLIRGALTKKGSQLKKSGTREADGNMQPFW